MIRLQQLPGRLTSALAGLRVRKWFVCAAEGFGKGKGNSCGSWCFKGRCLSVNSVHQNRFFFCISCFDLAAFVQMCISYNVSSMSIFISKMSEILPLSLLLGICIDCLTVWSLLLFLLSLSILPSSVLLVVMKSIPHISLCLTNFGVWCIATVVFFLFFNLSVFCQFVLFLPIYLLICIFSSSYLKPVFSKPLTMIHLLVDIYLSLINLNPLLRLLLSCLLTFMLPAMYVHLIISWTYLRIRARV